MGILSGVVSLLAEHSRCVDVRGDQMASETPAAPVCTHPRLPLGSPRM